MCLSLCVCQTSSPFISSFWRAEVQGSPCTRICSLILDLILGSSVMVNTVNMDSRPSRGRPMAKRLLFLMAPGVDAISSADCWVGGWTPEICCSAPGAKGNPLCWDSVFTFDRCCTETEEGIQFDLRRRNFVADMVRRGATVHFDIRHVSGGRTGAVASRALSARSTVLRVPSTQVFSLKSVHSAVIEASRP
eukprot:symbB.v1.2.035132.t1/scaffold4662.1/size36764/4